MSDANAHDQAYSQGWRPATCYPDPAITALDPRFEKYWLKLSAIERLAKELLEQEATGDRGRAEAWFQKYDRMPAALTTALAAARDVPVDVDPIFEVQEVIE